MSKINLYFGGNEYSVDSSTITPIYTDFKKYLSSVINGNGATIKFDGVSYNVDSNKLSNARNKIISHLNNTSNDGTKVLLNGTEYSIDFAKVTKAISDLQSDFTRLNNIQSQQEAGLYINGTLAYSWDFLVESGSMDIYRTDLSHVCYLDDSSFDLDGDLVISNSIEHILPHAFSGCSVLNSVVVPDSVTVIGTGAFSQCRRLKSVTLPANITVIEDNTFEECINLSSIKLPNSLNIIGNNAFYNCSSLINIVIPDNVESIGEFAFISCCNLTQAIIGENTRTIGTGAFAGCGLTSITIPSSVIELGSGAFYGCTSLSSITFTGTKDQWDSIGFGDEWCGQVPATYVQCLDGQVELSK